MDQDNDITFCIVNESVDHKEEVDDQKLINLFDLFDDFFSCMPKLFTITTKNGSYRFNVEILLASSKTIEDHLTLQPDQLQYHLDIDDEENVMGKFEQLYLGKIVDFNDSDISILMIISKLLQISSISDLFYSSPFDWSYRYVFSDKRKIKGIQIEMSSFKKKILEPYPKSFIITAKGKKYSCNKMGVYSSQVIQSILLKDPSIDQFVYELDDLDDDEFQIIQDFFNFQSIQINTSNMNSIKKIMDDLKIDCLYNKVNKFIKYYENMEKIIDEKSEVIDEVTKMFNLLYNKEKLSVEFVKNSILESVFVHSEENIQELAAFIIETVHNDNSVHQFIFDLLISLDKEASEENSLNLLMPLIIKKMIKLIGLNNFNCSFLYLLNKKGFISKNEIVNAIVSVDEFLTDKPKPKDMNGSFKHSEHNNVIAWFFPELIEIKQIGKDILFKNLDENIINFILKYYPNNIDGFKRMRDSGEPDDIITKSLIYDDIDTFQTILSKDDQNKNKFNNKVPYNIFEAFISEKDASYINYAASCGSIKCLKYLLLNQALIDESTLEFAVYGGNSEIIRIINQYKSNKINYVNEGNNEFHNYNLVSAALLKNNNDLFDWIIDQEFCNKSEISSYSFLKMPVSTGNFHGLLSCLYNGFDINLLSREHCESLLQASAESGFARLVDFLICLMKQKIKQTEESENGLPFVRQLNSSVLFGNLSIFKSFLSMSSKHYDLEKPLLIAIENEYMSIIKYIVETLFKDQILLSRGGVLRALSQAIRKKSDNLFTYLINQFKFENIQKKFGISHFDLNNFLLDGCSFGNVEAVKLITNLILEMEQNSRVDFTEPFIRATVSNSFEICHFFVEKKVHLNFFQLCTEASRLTAGDEKIFNLLISIADSETKELIFGSFLYESIKNKNKKLVALLLNERSTQYDFALFEAVQSHDLGIVNLVLERDSRPSFINRVSKSGTALNIAAASNDIMIVRRLLSLEGINPSLYESKKDTPLLSVIRHSMNIEMLEAFIDFYGDEISSQMWQIDEALNIIFKKLNSIESRKESLFRYNDSKKTNEIEDEKDKLFVMINRLLQIKNVNFNRPIVKQTLLTFACECNEIELVKILLKSDKIDVNAVEIENGNSPLMVAIENRNFEIIEFLIGFPQTDINLRNFVQQTSLTIAVNKNLENVVSLLVNNEKFDPDECRLNYAFLISSGQISSQLIAIKGLNVNFKYDKVSESYSSKDHSSQSDDVYDVYYSKYTVKKTSKSIYVFETSLIRAVSNNKIEMVDMIINHSTFDPVKSQLKTAIFISAQKNNGEIFKKLLKLIDDDVNIYYLNGQSLLIAAVISESQEIVSRIVNSPKFDPLKSDICRAFKISSFIDDQTVASENAEANINIMNILSKYDRDHSRLINFSSLLPNGKSFFTAVDGRLKNIDEIINYFLNNGVDVNEADKNGIYPMEYAIGINSIQFVTALINSGKIDYSKRICNRRQTSYLSGNNQTYLHLAARCKDFKIFSKILNLNIIDINSIDDLGETPLMEACKYNRINNIRELFALDDLDYQYCNNLGEDAIKIAQKCSNHYFYRQNNKGEEIIKTKEEYLNKLLSIISDTIANLGK